jgi:hypothetical protein
MDKGLVRPPAAAPPRRTSRCLPRSSCTSCRRGSTPLPARRISEASHRGLRDVPGLIRKQLIYAEDGWAGGVYLWQTRAAAEAFYAGPWLAGIRERYGMDP